MRNLTKMAQWRKLFLSAKGLYSLFLALYNLLFLDHTEGGVL